MLLFFGEPEGFGLATSTLPYSMYYWLFAFDGSSSPLLTFYAWSIGPPDDTVTGDAAADDTGAETAAKV